MATIKKVWKGEAILAYTNSYGGGVADLAADGAYDYTGDVDLETDGYEAANVTLEFDSSGTTDNIILGLFGSLDGSDFDDVALWEMEFDATSGNDLQVSIPGIRDLSHFRFGVKTNGTTNTFDYRIKWDAWRWDAT